MKCANTGCSYNGSEYENNCSITVDTTGCCDYRPAPRKSSDETLIKALRILAVDIKSGDGVANACISEAADRLAEFVEMEKKIGNLIKKLAD